jgi:AcrR family transcriptional regulator
MALRPRDRVIAAAIRLFLEEGIQAMGVARIVKEAGVAQMTLYRHFDGKDGVVAAAVEQWGAWWRGWILDQVDSCGDDPEARLAGLWMALEARLRSEDVGGSLVVVAAVELRRVPEHPAWKAIAEHRMATRQLLDDLVKPLHEHRPADLAGRMHLLVEGAEAAAVAGAPLGSLDLRASFEAARR